MNNAALMALFDSDLRLHIDIQANPTVSPSQRKCWLFSKHYVQGSPLKCPHSRGHFWGHVPMPPKLNAPKTPKPA